MLILHQTTTYVSTTAKANSSFHRHTFARINTKQGAQNYFGSWCPYRCASCWRRRWALLHRAQHRGMTGMSATTSVEAASGKRSRCRRSGVGRSCRDMTGQNPAVHSCCCDRSGRTSVGRNYRWTSGLGFVNQSPCCSYRWLCRCQTAGRCVIVEYQNVACSHGCWWRTSSSCLSTWTTRHLCRMVRQQECCGGLSVITFIILKMETTEKILNSVFQQVWWLRYIFFCLQPIPSNIS